MKPMSVCLFVLGSIALAVTALPAQEVETQKPKQVRAEVLHLQYAVADETVPIVFEALPVSYRASTKIISDARTNSLVVSGDDAAQVEVKRLVTMLDVQATPAKQPPAPRKAVTYEVVLFMLGAGAEEALKLPVTSTGVIDSSDADAVLAKVREGVGKSGVTEVAKLSLMADESRGWKSRQVAQVPTVNGPRGQQQFGGYQEAMLDFSIQPEALKGGDRRLAVSCKIERFTEQAEKDGVRDPIPPAKQSTTIDFNTPMQDGKLVMASVQSSASKFESSYILFIRVKS